MSWHGPLPYGAVPCLSCGFPVHRKDRGAATVELKLAIPGALAFRVQGKLCSACSAAASSPQGGAAVLRAAAEMLATKR